MYEDPPCERDLVGHLQLIKAAARRDKDIAKSKVCVLSIITTGHPFTGVELRFMISCC